MKIINQLFSKKLPIWFRLLNAIILLPSIIWPIIFFMSIFIFDKSLNLALTYLFFFIINLYPIYLIAIAYLNIYIYNKSKVLSLVIPIFVLVSVIWLIIEFLTN